MKKRAKHTWTVKKKEGSSSYLFIFFSVMAVFLLIMLDLDTSTNINRFQEVNQIGREYLLRMEADGYLTTEDRNDLKNNLSALGYVKNISISAPISAVDYGQEIELKIEYDIELEEIQFAGLFGSSPNVSEQHKVFNKKTTAKH